MRFGIVGLWDCGIVVCFFLAFPPYFLGKQTDYRKFAFRFLEFPVDLGFG